VSFAAGPLSNLTRTTCLSVVGFALFATGAAYAQPTDVIIVTAQKREENIQEVGISITAIQGEQLDELGITSGIDIIAQVPGIQVSGAGAGTNNGFNVRGVTQNAFAASLESPIAVYLDDSYLALNSLVDLALFDIARAEVLRGPQGTLFGRNATGGLVRYVTERPSQNFGGLINVEIGEDGRQRLEAAVGGALSDTVAGRLSGVFNRNDGLIKNDIGPDQMQADDYSVRGQLLFEPAEDLSILLRAQYSNEDSAKGGYSHVVARSGSPVTTPGVLDFFGYRDADGDPYTGSYDFPGYKRSEVVDLSANIDWTLDQFTISSVTNYQDITDGFGEDSDVSPNSVYHYEKSNDVNQFSQELRLAYSQPGLDLVVGAYYLLIDGVYDTRQTGDVFFGSAVEFTSVDQTTTSGAIFTQADIELTDQITLVAGGRYSRDEKEFSYDSTNVFDLVAPGAFQVVDDFTDDGVSAKLQLNYSPVDGWLWYAGVNRGIKSGGFNYPLFPTAANLFKFDGEVLTSYEAGFKSSLGDSTTLNVSSFFYDYDGYQAFSFDGLAARVLNVNAEMYGGEVELTTNPIEGLDLMLGLSYLENEVRDVPLAVSDGTEKAAITPKFTVNGLIRYEWPAFDGYIAAQLDGNWKDKVSFNLVPTPALEEDGYGLLNARLSYTPAGDNWSAAVFVRNLTDEYYRMYSFDTSPDFGALEDVPGVPRWVGASLSFTW
jgi:iron complex outermembrane receptor protein